MKSKTFLKTYAYSLLISFAFLFICSKNSPLYVLNDWVDANAFFTVGKSMVRGIVPYKELFEQKGPLLYFIYGIGSLISYDSFIGVFILEVILFSIFIYYSFKTITLFVDTKKAYFIIPLYTLFIVTLKSFSHGGSAEEFSLPFIMYTFYIFVRFLKTGNISKKQIFITGLLAGCVFWIKYTLLGLFIGYMLSMTINMFLNKKYKEMFINCGIFLLGFIISSIPWIIYFIITDSIKNMIDVYFLINIVLYPKKISIISKLSKTFELITYNLASNPIYFIFIVCGCVLFLFNNEKWEVKHHKLSIIISIILTGVCVFIGGTNYHYYPFALSPFIIIGLIELFKTVNINKIIIILTIILSLVSSFYASTNTYMLRYKRKNYAQYEFAKIIKEVENPKILNFGFLDGGFYLTTGLIPDCYYFMKNNIPYKNYPEMLDGQLKYIKEEKPDFIIIRGSGWDKAKDTINDNYNLVKVHKQKYQQYEVTYKLYRIKNK